MVTDHLGVALVHADTCGHQQTRLCLWCGAKLCDCAAEACPEQAAAQARAERVAEQAPRIVGRQRDMNPPAGLFRSDPSAYQRDVITRALLHENPRAVRNGMDPAYRVPRRWVADRDVFGNWHEPDENGYCSCWQCPKPDGHGGWWQPNLVLQQETRSDTQTSADQSGIGASHSPDGEHGV